MMNDVKEICPTTTQKRIKAGAILVDVRERVEIERLSFDVPELIIMPLSELENRFTELSIDKELILVCQHGVRSLKATYFLMYHGYNNVTNMSGGMTKWVLRQFPIKGDPTAIEMPVDGGRCC